MLGLPVRIVAVVAAVLLLDRVLLWLEARNVLRYRKSKGAWKGSTYHFLEMSSIFEPSLENTIEVKYEEQEEETEAGDSMD